MMNRKIKKSDKKEITRALSMFLQMGLSMAVCVFIGFWLGKSLDGWLHTTPLFLLICTLLGIAAAIKTMYDLAMKNK